MSRSWRLSPRYENINFGGEREGVREREGGREREGERGVVFSFLFEVLMPVFPPGWRRSRTETQHQHTQPNCPRRCSRLRAAPPVKTELTHVSRKTESGKVKGQSTNYNFQQSNYNNSTPYKSLPLYTCTPHGVSIPPLPSHPLPQ